MQFILLLPEKKKKKDVKFVNRKVENLCSNVYVLSKLLFFFKLC